MSQYPRPTASTNPSCVTVAISSSLEDQVTVLIDASSGYTVADNWWVPPSYSSISVSLIETAVTGVCWIVQVHCAVNPLSTVVTVMMQLPLPIATAVTTPSWSTVAIVSSLDDQVTSWTNAHVGRTCASNLYESPEASSISDIFNVTPVTLTE